MVWWQWNVFVVLHLHHAGNSVVAWGLHSQDLLQRSHLLIKCWHCLLRVGLYSVLFRCDSLFWYTCLQHQLLQLLYAIFILVVVSRELKAGPMYPISLLNAAIFPFFPIIAVCSPVTSTSNANFTWLQGMYPSFIVLIMAKQQSVFGGSTFIVCSDNNPAVHDVSQQQSRALSALQFACSQESASLQSQLVSTHGGFSQPMDGVLHVDAEKAV